jgi:hypothetical protein
MAGAAERAPKLAYAKVGTGPPLVRPAHWLGHLELPFHRHLLLDLAREFKLIRYDARPMSRRMLKKAERRCSP